MNAISDLSELKNIGENYILYFYSNDDPYHKHLISILDNVQNRIKIKIIGIDADYFKKKTEKHNISFVPQILFFRNKKQVKRIYTKINSKNILKGVNYVFEKNQINR